MSYRPDNWKELTQHHSYSDEEQEDACESGIEIGADAMLEAIIKRLRDIYRDNQSIYYGASCRRIADMLEIKDDD